MGKFRSSRGALYLSAFSIIFGWWFAAFMLPHYNSSLNKHVKNKTRYTRVSTPGYLNYLSELKRDQIHQALCGDVRLMAKLMADWDVDAQILENHGFVGVKRLHRQDFIKGQMLGRSLTKNDPMELAELQSKHIACEVLDDTGAKIDSSHEFKKFLPQTFVAASFLLALTEPENIVAIPQGLRNQVELYPPFLTEKVPLDIDRYNSEKLYSARPDIAFVAPYSLPSTLDALRNQGIPLFTLKSINTLPEIADAIQRVGSIIRRPLEADLLTLFMESAMNAIDNQLLAVSQAMIAEHGSPRIMFLNYYAQYSCPTSKTITGRLLQRLSSQKFTFIPSPHEKSNDWSIPIEQEQIVHTDPDCLIIASINGEALKKTFQDHPALSELSAAHEQNIFFIDDAPQAPTQYIILAYYDLAEALAQYIR